MVKDRTDQRCKKRKSMSERGMCFSVGKAALSELVAVDEKRLVAAERNSVEEKSDEKEESDSSEHVACRSLDKWPMVLLRKAFCWETKKRDFR